MSTAPVAPRQPTATSGSRRGEGRGRPPPAAPSRSIRRERLIAGCRVALALFSLLALWLDPSEPARFAALAYALVAAYAGYALLFAAWAWHARVASPWLPVVVHALDLGFFAFLVLVTEGGTSPFFAWFVFALAAAAVRWPAAGVLRTAACALVLFLGVAIYSSYRLPGSPLELNRLLIRSAYLAVVAVLLAYVGAHEDLLRSRTASLADWPEATPSDPAALVGALLASAARTLAAPRVLLAWEEAEEPWCHLASWSDGALEWRRAPPEELLPLAPAELAEAAFLLPPPTAADGAFRLVLPEGRRRWPRDPLPAWLRGRLGTGAVLSVPVRGESLGGRLFVLDQPEMTTDELVLGELVARKIAVRLDQLALFERFHESGLSEERIRFARDLHDGVIQSLAAAALRLESVRQLSAHDPAAAGRLLDEVQDLLGSEQRGLRDIIASLVPEGPGQRGRLPALRERVERLAARMGRHWDLEVEIDDRLPAGAADERFGHEIHAIVQEALVNASRHGRATRARVELWQEAGEVRLTIADDGHGFPFQGTLDHATLTSTRLGPVSLKQRIAALGGRLSITSSEAGARLEIALPRAEG